MVHAPSHIAADGITHAIIKKSVLTGFIRMVQAEDVNQTPCQEFFIHFPDLGVKRHVTQNSFGIMHVKRMGSHIEITAKNQFLLVIKVLLEVFFEPFEPLQLIGKLWLVHILSLRNISINHDKVIKKTNGKPVLVRRLSRQAEVNFLRFFSGGYRHAVILFIALKVYVISGFLKFCDGKFCVFNLGLLHAEKIRLVFIKPRNDDMKP